MAFAVVVIILLAVLLAIAVAVPLTRRRANADRKLEERFEAQGRPPLRERRESV